MNAFQTLPGFREFLPEQCRLREHFFRQWRQVLRGYGFEEWDGPVLEPLELYVEKSGPEIVNQLFHFEDRGGRRVALRPELTPTLARLVGSRAQSLKRPVRWFSIGEHYRFERPQKGRLRAFYQLNADILGEPSEVADAELMACLASVFLSFGLGPEKVSIRLSDRVLWTLFLESLGFSGDGQGMDAVLQIVDKLDRQPREKLLQDLEPWFSGASEDFLAKVEGIRSIRSLEEMELFFSAHLQGEGLRERLEERLVSWRNLIGLCQAHGLGEMVRIDLSIVRGLAYYTGFVFEAFEARGSGRALAGGGRYDSLVEKMGGSPMPAAGFALGDVTFAELLRDAGCLPNLINHPDLYVVHGGGECLRSALPVIASLRARGFSVLYSFRKGGFGKQFREASQSGARLALLFGPDEVAAGEVVLKNLRERSEEKIALSGVVGKVEALLRGL